MMFNRTSYRIPFFDNFVTKHPGDSLQPVRHPPESWRLCRVIQRICTLVRRHPKLWYKRREERAARGDLTPIARLDRRRVSPGHNFSLII